MSPIVTNPIAWRWQSVWISVKLGFEKNLEIIVWKSWKHEGVDTFLLKLKVNCSQSVIYEPISFPFFGTAKVEGFQTWRAAIQQMCFLLAFTAKRIVSLHCVRAIEPFCSEEGFIKTYTIVTVPICAALIFSF